MRIMAASLPLQKIREEKETRVCASGASTSHPRYNNPNASAPVSDEVPDLELPPKLWAHCGSGSRLDTRRFDTGEIERERVLAID